MSASSWPAGSSKRWPARSPSSTRCTGSGSSTTATCWASSTAPRTRTGRWPSVATAIGDEDPDFAGACYVHVQKYVHDMSSWNSMSVTEQERVIGRTKLEDIELDDDVKPADSHLALNVITDDDGNELKIVRHNMPFGEVGKGEFGTYFIGYSRTPRSPNGCCATCSSATRPATPIASSTSPPPSPAGLFFTPTVDFLDDPPPLPGLGRAAAAPAVTSVRYDGSLVDRQPERNAPMNNLYRDLAPITEVAWAEIELEATPHVQAAHRRPPRRRRQRARRSGHRCGQHRASARRGGSQRRCAGTPAGLQTVGAAAGSVHPVPHRYRRRRARLAGLGLGPSQGCGQEAGVRRGPRDLRGLRRRAIEGIRKCQLQPRARAAG